MRASDLSTRDVINVSDGRRLGHVVDLDIDLQTGKILALVVPGESKLLGVFGRSDDFVVPWSNVKKIGEDVILVEVQDQYLRTVR